MKTNYPKRPSEKEGSPMNPASNPTTKLFLKAAILSAGLALVACAPQYAPPQQVSATNPQVTYKYRSDAELVQVNQTASLYCGRYQAVPQTARFGSDPDGSRVVVFDCMPAAPVQTVLVQPNPNLAYSYRTDQELLDGSRNAQAYCMSNGMQHTVANITTNANGTKTATYQCSPR
jgi:hypothetical protein